MIAVAAAAHAVDGLYGTVKPLIKPPPSRARRARQIIETLKLGFAIGPEAVRLQQGLDWLFETRDRAVHHAEDFRPLVVSHTTKETVVVSAPESFDLSAAAAVRASTLAREVIDLCLAKPKAGTREWADARREGRARRAAG